MTMEEFDRLVNDNNNMWDFYSRPEERDSLSATRECFLPLTYAGHVSLAASMPG